ncbi:MAG: dephospho-CoA kinase [Flavobacteriales bacterium]|nr:dephospho-CoA kinase [Flavobacteriales bacterium]
MVKIIGLTGGIGSGKSTMAKVFEALGVPVFYADDVARKIYDADAEILYRVKEIFGNEVFSNDLLDKKKLGQIVFSDNEKLKQLNAIVHPAVRKAFTHWAEQHVSKSYIIREAAILIESDAHKDCDEIVLVTAPEALRIARVIKRDGVSEEAVRNRMKHQWSDEEKRKFISIELVNDDRELIVPQIVKLHEQFSRTTAS